MWSFVTDTPSAVQMIMLVSCSVMGLSHIVQPGIWFGLFAGLSERGTSGIITSAFINMIPATMIVSLHQVWSGPAILVTLYGWALLIKVCVCLLAPSVGLRSMKLSRHGVRAFVFAGAFLMVIGLASGLALAGVGG